MSLPLDEKTKTRLFGMIKLKKKIQLDDAASILNISANILENLLFELAGEGKIEGELVNREFIICSDINTMIALLDQSFGTWTAKEESKEGKINNLSKIEFIDDTKRLENIRNTEIECRKLVDYHGILLFKIDFEVLKTLEVLIGSVIPRALIKNIKNAYKNIDAIKTRYLFGKDLLTSAITDSIWQTKSTIIIITPDVMPEILESLSVAAIKNKNARFFYYTKWDLTTWGSVTKKMIDFCKNIQFWILNKNESFILFRDEEKVIFGTDSKEFNEVVAITSIQEAYCKLFSSFISVIINEISKPI